MDLQKYLLERKKLVDTRLERLLPQNGTPPSLIHRAMRYSLMIGGKRIRPVLTLAACEAVGGDWRKALDAACAIELIHTYSLIHDDLPCMDNDDFRRGKPTSHKVFGEAAAVLAGDALLTFSFEIVAASKTIPAVQKPALVSLIARAAGSQGLIGGQVVDMESEGKKVSAKTVEYIHAHKTACLISAAIETGAMIGGAKVKELSSLKRYGRTVGLTFQIADDILDITGTKEKLGKGIGKDVAQKKATYPSVYGIERSRAILEEKTQEAVRSLGPFGAEAAPLREIAVLIARRDR
ncbi:MAG TPA: polyprenyl synthetase family protein [bacterium]|nr:polyprenyl synthetase family protein [bacterium]